MPNPKQVYQLKVTLDNVKPPVWRRLVVAENTDLFSLHEIIQAAMGWQNYHLHMFTIAGQIYGDPQDDEYGDLDTKNETRYRLNKLGLTEKAKFKYEYDFGDGWQHTILVEKILPAEKGVHYPLCLTGKRACPPEDVGGIWGYANFLEALTNPKHDEHTEYLEWIGGAFDPEAFDLDNVNQGLRSVNPARGSRMSRLEPNDKGLVELLPTGQEQIAMAENLSGWLNNLDGELAEGFESLPLRRDVMTFLDYLSKNPIAGTQSTGNLPLKAVHAICGRFVNPPILEETIGSSTFKTRSEDGVWPLVFVHTLAFNSRLVDGGAARKWKTTPEGDLFSRLLPPVQVYFLFLHWMIASDWSIAYQFAGLENGLLQDFKLAAQNNLSALLVGKNMPYEPFAKLVIAESGLEWHNQDQRFVQMIKLAVVENLVISPMIRFGVLECGYRPNDILGGDYKDLDTLRLTALGKELLTLLKKSP